MELVINIPEEVILYDCDIEYGCDKICNCDNWSHRIEIKDTTIEADKAGE